MAGFNAFVDLHILAMQLKKKLRGLEGVQIAYVILRKLFLAAQACAPIGLRLEWRIS